MTRLVAILGVALLAACAEPRDLPADDCTKVSVHGCGILDPASEDFHGRELERQNWNFELCASCHGADFAGTTKAPTCRTCHVDGPTACGTCHEASPTTGAHANHLTRGVACGQCHVVPTAWNDEGHILIAGVADPAPAEVVMAALAATTIDPANRAGPPTFDRATSTCAEVYCHGAVLGDSGGTSVRPRWANTGGGPAPCTSCHGQPPPSHSWSTCTTCHPADAPHLNGTIDITTACNSCHGSAASPAPPRDLSGNQLSTALGVGAHQVHLTAPHGISAPVPCSACHVVPTSVDAVGHLDSLGPAEVVASLGWDRGTATCASAWCHGPSRPTWTVTGQVACGTCHGVPPATPWHAGATLRDCATCHPNTVDGFGNILIVDGPSGPTSAHLDGDVDAP